MKERQGKQEIRAAKRRLRVLTNLLELSFLTVLAFPKASKMVLASSTCSSTQLCDWEREVSDWRMCFVDSVLPAPDSPLVHTKTLNDKNKEKVKKSCT
jgi:hypothetical protein